ncbi:hypothetical protein FJY71_07015, partial [candidate division WOR-3 bacterium]|nr:hypothetical protein [candidate division WOR-3 bacterium]
FAIPRLFDPAVSLVAIACLLLLARRLGIVGLAAGWTLGHVAALAVVLLPLVRAGRRLLTRLSDAGTGRFLRLAAPAMLLAAVQPLNIAIGRAFASSLPAGSIAMLGYADRLFMLPTYILLASLTPVLLTKSSELSAAGRTVELRRHFSRLLAVLALTLIPVTLALVPLSEPLVRLIYQRGAFTAAAAQATARALACFGLGLFPAAAAGVLAVAFRGRKDMATPLAAMLCGTAANAGAALLLVGPMGIAGLALAVSAGQTVVALVLGLRFLRWARA